MKRISFVFFPVLLLAALPALQSLEDARALWEAGRPAAYRLALEVESPFLTCQQDYEVQGDEVVYIHTDECRFGVSALSAAEPPTIDDLFDQLAADSAQTLCGENGCVCDGPVSVSAEYEPTLGYPVRIFYQLRQDWRWRDPAFWAAWLTGALADCPPVGDPGRSIRVVSLTPLPGLQPDKPPTPTPTPAPPDAAKTPGPTQGIGDAFPRATETLPGGG